MRIFIIIVLLAIIGIMYFNIDVKINVDKNNKNYKSTVDSSKKIVDSLFEKLKK